MAGIIKKGRKYVAIFRDQYGKEIRKTTGVDHTPKNLLPNQNAKRMAKELEVKARLIADALEREYHSGEDVSEYIHKVLGGTSCSLKLTPKKEILTIEEFFKNWLIKRRSKNTIRAMERDKKAIERFLLFLGKRAKMKASDLTLAMTTEFVEKECERVSPNTVLRYVSTLSTAFNEGIRNKLVVFNPFVGCSPSRKEIEREKHKREAFTIEEVEYLVQNLPEEWSDMFLVALYTGGQRLGDICTLKWEQIDLQEQVLCMTTGKTGREMRKPIISVLAEIFEKRLKYRIDDYVFPIARLKYNGEAGKGSISYEFTRLLIELGVAVDCEPQGGGDRRRQASKSFHSIRNTAVTMLRNAGVPADLCRHIVGHDSEMIERAYYRPSLADEANVLEKIVKIK